MLVLHLAVGLEADMDAWVERELAAGEFPDERLKTRLGQLLGDLVARIGHTLPAACQDWAATKATNRFFDNPRVNDQNLRLKALEKIGTLLQFGRD